MTNVKMSQWFSLLWNSQKKKIPNFLLEIWEELNLSRMKIILFFHYFYFDSSNYYPSAQSLLFYLVFYLPGTADSCSLQLNALTVFRHIIVSTWKRVMAAIFFSNTERSLKKKKKQRACNTQLPRGSVAIPVPLTRLGRLLGVPTER